MLRLYRVDIEAVPANVFTACFVETFGDTSETGVSVVDTLNVWQGAVNRGIRVETVGGAEVESKLVTLIQRLLRTYNEDSALLTVVCFNGERATYAVHADYIDNAFTDVWPEDNSLARLEWKQGEGWPESKLPSKSHGDVLRYVLSVVSHLSGRGQ